MYDFVWDFSSILFILAVVTGLISFMDKRSWSKSRANKEEASWWIRESRAVFPVIVIIFFLRSFLIEPYRIPSGSMIPTLYVGDFIVVNKFSYGVRLPGFNYPLIHTWNPERGDVAVFRHPQTRVNYVKRVIGVPGDVIRYENKNLFVNGILIEQENSEPFVVEGIAHTLRKENLTGVVHDVLLNPYRDDFMSKEWQVPEGHYFGMGDNRDNSLDSRMWGFFPEADLIGKVFGVWMNWNSDTDSWLPINWARVGKGVS